MRVRLLAVGLALAGFGCGEHAPAPEETMADADDPYAQYRVLAESYILRTIGELDQAAEARLMAAIEGGPYQNANEALDVFEAEESVTVDHVEWVQETWRSRKAENSNADPQAFAAEVANDVFSEVDF
jgi:hypothetical protein